ncbi:branched-chain amino acid ABC transporter ATP-binding protein/permease [Thermomicrobium sp. CFH 73360]|uniref:branched-chain amino acid ABC transporter ATP-binding protein/permease n=1 Tax=Thermomicrobium sp. CFH 73360 TaxID=2951987 RepID=UPI0020766F17|nr:branched-chain amino acid ABC transporter ATP-binding protein/permease [Thermomicrobium sp. CFH 73360]MCM8745265.1 branched-chain amino acid ABC transporter ATP-binding protein/permease [Thermomicrobium sp. CFH 73360]
MTSIARVAVLPVLLLLTALVPFAGNDFYIALGLSILLNAVLATAWGLFAGPTKYISLATAAFFGVGAYTVGLFYERVPMIALYPLAALIGAVLAVFVGLTTLRIQGMYFTIFTFGLAELIRQLMTWYQRSVTGSVGVYIITDITARQIYWSLTALLALTLFGGWLLARSRYGLALLMIGEDELAARHSGVRTTAVKVVVLALTSAIMAVTGAIVAPRWTYLDPNIAFNPTLSFMPAVIALLGGMQRFWGPLVGAVPLVFLFDQLNARFPTTYTFILGVLFMMIVFAIPDGILGLLPKLQQLRRAAPAPAAPPASLSAPLEPSTPVRGASPSVDGMSSPTRSPSPDGSVLLEVQGLRKAFGGIVAVDDLSFTIREGEVFGIIGPNGSGKTTVLNLISGVYEPDRGKILFLGRSLAHKAPEEIARAGIARTFQLVRIYPALTCLDHVVPAALFGGHVRSLGEARVYARELLEELGMGQFIHVPAGQLNFIDQKRLELARALALRPKLLLLDEWLAGLNPSEMLIGMELIESLRGRGTTIVLIEHLMQAVRRLCDRCIVMSFGQKIAEGTPEEVLAHPEVVRVYLGETDDA